MLPLSPPLLAYALLLSMASFPRDGAIQLLLAHLTPQNISLFDAVHAALIGCQRSDEVLQSTCGTGLLFAGTLPSLVRSCSCVLVGVGVWVVLGETSNTSLYDTMLGLVGAKNKLSRARLKAVLQLLPDDSLAKCMCCAAVVASYAVRVHMAREPCVPC